MTQEKLKDALISLLLGVLTMAAFQILEGLLQLTQEWLSNAAGGVTASSVYLKLRNLV